MDKTMAEEISASVVICTFNRRAWLERCLGSVLAQARPGVDVIVVDGPSSDGSREMLEARESMGELVLVRQGQLEGISAARNLGLGAARGEIVCFVDDDVILEQGWLTAITAPYRDPKVGGAGGPVLDLEGKLVMGRNFVSRMGEWSETNDDGNEAGVFPVMVGCNMSFRTEVLRSVGGFDPDFRFHQDETDACLRVQFRGYRVEYVEGARVRHAWCEGSYRRDKILWYLKLRYLWGRNDAYLVRKNFGGEVSFFRYLGHKLLRSVSLRKGPGTGESASSVSDVPAPMSALGATLEISGAARGWLMRTLGGPG